MSQSYRNVGCSIARFVMGVLPIAFALCFSSNIFAAEYFIDQAHPQASDSNVGTEALPWRSLYKLNNVSLQPGDIVSVKAGTYMVTSGGNWDAPAINLLSSGEEGRPITVRAFQGARVVVDAAGQGSPPLGSHGKNWITLDGFEIRNTGSKAVAIFDSTGFALVNCKIYGVINLGLPGDNTDAVRIERSDRTLVRNCDVSNVDSRQPNHINGAAFKIYDSTNVVIENNYVHDIAGSGFFDKQGGNNNTFRYNLVERVYHAAYTLTAAPRTKTNIKIHNNIIRNVTNVLTFDAAFVSSGLQFYSNTVVNYGNGVRLTSPGATSWASFYNNIFSRNADLAESSSSEISSQGNINGDYSELQSVDYNVFAANNRRWILNLYDVGGPMQVFGSIDAWKSAGNRSFDSGSLLVQTVEFVNAPNSDYRLAPGSPLRLKARRNGVPSGEAIDPGAYSTGLETIGLAAGLPTQVASRPAPPSAIVAN